MPYCVECDPKRVYPTVKALWLHLQKEHRMNALSTFKCGEQGCCRKFSSGKAFVRHVKSHVNVGDIQGDCDSNIGCHVVISECDTSGTCSDVDTDVVTVTEDSDVPLSVKDGSFQDALQSQSDAFVCKYYSKPSLPRNVVQNIVDDVQDLLSNGVFMNILRDKVMQALQSCQAEESLVEEISGMFNAVQNPFEHLQTEYLRKQYFEKSGYYAAPEVFELGKRLQQVKTANGMKWKWVSVTAVHVPLAPVLKNFLELPDALQCILDYMKQLQDQKDSISNFIQGKLWKEKLKKFSPTEIVLPLFVYFDDFEGNNPLGAHLLKIGGVYVIIGCLPPEIASKIENIFLSTLFCSGDRQEFKAKSIIKPLLEELINLERDGIHVTLSSGNTVRVFFVLCLVLGDNLGLHQLCGFVCGFAWANYPCRFCKVPQERMRYDVSLDKSLLRTKTNYENDLVVNDQTKTGISEKCVFNDLESFHITENLEGDLLHDFDEGLNHYVVTFVLTKLTTAESRNTKPVFSLATLNRRMQLFDFGTHSALYKTKLGVTAQDLEKGKLKMTGSEMEWFSLALGVLVGDLVPNDNLYWKLYLALRNVLDIVRAKTLPSSTLEILPHYLKVLAELFLAHDGNHIMFKFHKILWHYCAIFEHSGPVAKLGTRRFESKHRELKLGLYSNMSRRNACLSAAIKHQLSLCHRFVAKKSVLPDIELGSGSVLSSVSFPDFYRFQDDLKAIFSNLSNVFLPTWIDYKGSHYDFYSTLLIDIDDNFGWPKFGEVKCIFVCSNKVAVLCKRLETVGYSEHLHAFEVKRTKEKVCLQIDSLVDYSPLNTLQAPRGGGLYVILRHQI
ncbi:Formamidopyrimidine-DNA glycosylase [Frankliniella fusca]|uniref:Formamidopyrimidine-DNA glycosylase n=1 Tax=Frankliniella fusca TaxID=407009 RepID=A0AAE1L7Y7_9NEOP|nr:Formamidopyrimidine-DNA glycosylase [Frankliniella fusca]